MMILIEDKRIPRNRIVPLAFSRPFWRRSAQKLSSALHTGLFCGTVAAAKGLLQDETTKRVWNRRRIAMSDPRYTDPRLSDPVLRRDEAVGGPWSWLAGIAVIALIAFLVIVGWNSSDHTASNNSSPATTGSAMQPMTPPATTGSGAGSPRPLTPAPATPRSPPAGSQ
jgi:hypothetical protein